MVMVKYLVALFVLFVLTIVAQAQSGQPKSEIGGQVSISRQYQLYSGTSFDSTGTQIGVGARYTFNFTPALAILGGDRHAEPILERGVDHFAVRRAEVVAVGVARTAVANRPRAVRHAE